MATDSEPIKTMILSGITRHGKNHVTNHGDTWRVVHIWDRVLFTDRRGPWICLESLNGKGFVQWVHGENDDNFRIEKV